MTIVIAIIVFSLLVIAHEFGHYIVARKCGIKVEEFAIGMGPKLVGKQFGETLYSIRVFPIGGFCKMLGEDESSSDQRAFNNKKVPARIAVVVAGAIMNFLLAFLIVFFLTSINGFYIPEIESNIEGLSAQAAGLTSGDKILAINGEKIHLYQDLQLIMSENKGEPVTLTIERNAITENILVTPQKQEGGSQYLIGFYPNARSGIFSAAKEGYQKASLWETVRNTGWTLVFYVKSTVTGLVRLVSFKVSSDEIAGPIGIVQIMGDAYETGLESSVAVGIMNIASIAALLSANLGAVNLIPLPALDGGRLIFLLIELFRRKPIDPEKEGMVHFAGFVLLMILMVYIAYNDIVKLL